MTTDPSLKSKTYSVNIPAAFPAAIADAFLKIPNATLSGNINAIIQLEVSPGGYQDFGFCLTAGDCFQLQRLHEAYQNNLLVDGYRVPVSLSTGRAEIIFSQEDLAAIFHVVDKVISGADPVFLSGTLVVNYLDGPDMQGNAGFAMGSPLADTGGVGG